MVRLFVAVELPAIVRERLAALQGGVPAARWVRAESLHLTLRFIGEVDYATARDINAALGRVRAPAFDVSVVGVGCFGPDKRPRALWAGTDPSPPLQFLRDKVDRAVVAAGLGPDDRKFKAHVTLARFRDRPGPRLARWLTDNSLLRIGPVPVDRFVLFESTLGGEGAVYRPIADYPLTPEPGHQTAGAHGVAHEELLQRRQLPDGGEADVTGPSRRRHGIGE